MANLADIEAKLQQAKKKLSDMRAMHYSMALSYGSELCAGDMERQEREVEEEIAALERKRDQLTGSFGKDTSSQQPPEKASGSEKSIDAELKRALHARDYERMRTLLLLHLAKSRRD